MLRFVLMLLAFVIAVWLGWTVFHSPGGAPLAFDVAFLASLAVFLALFVAETRRLIAQSTGVASRSGPLDAEPHDRFAASRNSPEQARSRADQRSNSDSEYRNTRGATG